MRLDFLQTLLLFSAFIGLVLMLDAIIETYYRFRDRDSE